MRRLGRRHEILDQAAVAVSLAPNDQPDKLLARPSVPGEDQFVPVLDIVVGSEAGGGGVPVSHLGQQDLAELGLDGQLTLHHMCRASKGVTFVLLVTLTPQPTRLFTRSEP